MNLCDKNEINSNQVIIIVCQQYTKQFNKES